MRMVIGRPVAFLHSRDFSVAEQRRRPKTTHMWRTFLGRVGVAITSFGFGAELHAIDYNWNGSADTNWLNGANWTPAGPPTGGDGNFARFTTPGPNQPTINADVPVVQDYLTGPGGIVITHTAGNAFQNGWFRMGGLAGGGNVGTYNLSGGVLQASSYRIVEALDQVGTLNVTGGTFRQSDVDPANGDQWARIGQNGTANVNLSGTGLISFDSRVLIGVGTGSATVTQTGGTFQVRRGEFTLGDAFNTLSATPNVNYNISGGTLEAISPLDNGDTGGNITVAQWGNANARLAISGTATVRATRDILIADVDTRPGPDGANAGARGEIAQSGGTVSYARGFVAGRMRTGANFGDGTYTLSGGTFTQDAVADGENQGTWNHIGQQGTGAFNISGGTASFDSRTHVGSVAGGIGTVTQTGGLFEVRRHDLIIGDTGTGTYNVSGGTLQTLAGRPINVGHWNSSVGNLNVSGTGQVIAGGDINLGNGDVNPNGTLTQTGGTVIINGNLGMANVATATGRYDLGGGVLNMTGGNINRGPGTATFNFTGGRLQDVANINNFDFNQAGGVLAPGAAGLVGAININAGAGSTGAYSLGAGGTLELNIEVASFDQLIVAGTVTLAGNLDLLRGAGLGNGQTFQVVTNNSVGPLLGTFLGKPDDTAFFEDGSTWMINYQGGDGNDVVLTHIVPEPAGGALLLSTLALGAFFRRRRA